MTRDPLIVAAKIGIIATRAILLFGGAVLLAVIVFTIVASDAQLAESAAEMAEFDAAPGMRHAMLALFGLAFLVVAAAERFFQQLQAIVATVPAGNPFDPANADRLRRMAWLAVGFQIVSLAASMLSAAAKNLGEQIDVTLEVTFEGIFLAILLFILARVFRLGTAMREDLEGTV